MSITYSGTSALPYVGGGVGIGTNGTPINVSSNSNLNGVATPKGHHLTWTIPPGTIDWSTNIISRIIFDNIVISNDSSATKDISWGLRTGNCEQWNENKAIDNLGWIWGSGGFLHNTGSTWITYNEIPPYFDPAYFRLDFVRDANPLATRACNWFQSKFISGNNVYISCFETKTVNGNENSTSVTGDTTYSTRYYNNILGFYIIYDNSPVIHRYTGSTWENCNVYRYTSNVWQPVVLSRIDSNGQPITLG